VRPRGRITCHTENRLAAVPQESIGNGEIVAVRLIVEHESGCHRLFAGGADAVNRQTAEQQPGLIHRAGVIVLGRASAHRQLPLFRQAHTHLAKQSELTIDEAVLRLHVQDVTGRRRDAERLFSERAVDDLLGRVLIHARVE